MISKDAYKRYVEKNAPRSPMWRSMTAAFLVGMSEEDIASWTTVTLIFLGAFLTAVGVYDKLGHFAGGGSIVPITGFANSVVSPAVEYNREGVFFGVCAKMFVIAGPIIVFGVVASVIAGLIGLITEAV